RIPSCFHISKKNGESVLGEEKGTSLINLLRAAGAAEGEAEIEAAGGLLHPGGVAPGPTALDALAQRVDGCWWQRTVHPFDPVGRASQRPAAERQVGGAISAPIQPAEAPIFGAGN